MSKQLERSRASKRRSQRPGHVHSSVIPVPSPRLSSAQQRLSTDERKVRSSAMVAPPNIDFPPPPSNHDHCVPSASVAMVEGPQSNTTSFARDHPDVPSGAPSRNLPLPIPPLSMKPKLIKATLTPTQSSTASFGSLFCISF